MSTLSRRLAASALVLALAAGCSAQPRPAPASGSTIAAAAVEPAAPPSPRKPPPLPVEPLQVITDKGPITFQVEIADDDAEREYGLMNRPAMADDRGMIFDFHEPQRVAFWMRNTLIPLDMLFVAEDGRVLNIARMAKPHDETPVPSAGPIRAVIEINGGLAERLGIQPGDRVIDQAVFSAR